MITIYNLTKKKTRSTPRHTVDSLLVIFLFLIPLGNHSPSLFTVHSARGLRLFSLLRWPLAVSVVDTATRPTISSIAVTVPSIPWVSTSFAGVSATMFPGSTTSRCFTSIVRFWPRFSSVTAAISVISVSARARPGSTLFRGFAVSKFHPVFAILSVIRVIIVHGLEQLFLEVACHMLRVHEVAIATAITSPLIVLSAFGFTEISHRRKLSNDYFSRIVSAIKTLHGCLGLVLLLIFHIYTTD